MTAAESRDEAALFATLEADLADSRPGVDDHPHAHQHDGEGVRALLVPLWLRDRATITAAARWAAGSVVHAATFHGLRLPLYWARLVGMAPAGAARILAAWWRWALDVDGAAVHQVVTSSVLTGRAAAKAPRTTTFGELRERHADPAAGVTARLDAETYLRLASHHRSAVSGRLTISALLAAIAVPLTMGLAAALTPAGRLAAVLAVLPVLGLAGRTVDHPVTSRATDSAVIPRLTSDLLLVALGSLGIAELNKALTRGDGVRFPGPITRDGPGWRADIDLPPGVTAGDVIERRDRLASGLRRPLGCVWPTGDGDAHAGRLVVWVADKAMANTKPATWPLAARGAVDLFEPFPLGADPRGRTVPITLMFASMVVGAQPRMGKSFTVRLLLLAAALDPRAELHIYDLKGGADFLPLDQVAHRFRIGDDPDDIAYLLADLRAAKADMARRYKVLRSLPREVCPEGKVTPALANRRDLGLHPVVWALDECQRAFEHPEHGKEIAATVEDLSKRGPAAGVMVICATQRPDARSLPTGISSNAALRFCLRVAGQIENDMVLGTSSYQGGTRATMFTRADRGVGYLAGEGEDPVIVRTAYLDAEAADKIAGRARAARKLAGLLTGHAAGVEDLPEQDRTTVLDHLLEVWPPDLSAVWCADLAERLAETWPARYGGWIGEQVTAAVKPHGVSPRQVKRTLEGRVTNRNGLGLVDVQAARDGHHGGG